LQYLLRLQYLLHLRRLT